VIPLFFGTSESPIYGVLHQAQEDRKQRGVVLCPPFGQEYMRSHRAFRQLAFLLERKGFDVLRFDYRGTGDSSGDPTDFTAEDWIQDIASAAEELREACGVSNISIVGLRLGALLAAAACSGLSGINQLVLWDPVLSGVEYDIELVKNSEADVPNDRGVVAGNGALADGSLSYNGFVMSLEYRRSISILNLLKLFPVPANRTLEIVSHETPAFETLRATGSNFAGFEYQLVPAPHDWNYVDDFGGILLPQPVIQAIVQWLHTSSPNKVNVGSTAL
jgi:pimeloyl-ACP methyl ester carboxylesterase